MPLNIFGRKAHQFEVAICCIVRNEEYLAEWIDYHVLTGVPKFYIYDNESVIPVKETLKSYVQSGLVEVIDFPGQVMQLPAYHHCLEHHGPRCKWIAFIDADEFIVPKTTTGNLPDFLKDYEEYAGLGVNWLVFGSNGHEHKQASTIKSYTRRSLKTYVANKHIKSIVRPEYIIKAITPHDFQYKKGSHGVNENFVKLTGPFSLHSSNKIRLNHYFTRSKEDFMHKKGRGRADTDQEVHQRTMKNFEVADKNSNVIIDESILEVMILIERLKNGTHNEDSGITNW